MSNTDLELIAKDHGIDTLETRHSDSLDFHNLAVWTICEMLEQAYAAGEDAARAQPDLFAQ